MICDITTVTPSNADADGSGHRFTHLKSVVTEPIPILTKELIGSDTEGRLGSAVASAASPEDAESIARYTTQSVAISGWRVTGE